MIKYEIQRLKDINLKSINFNSFKNIRNPNLVLYLKDHALEDDMNNKNAVFLVIDKDTKEIIFYYALKTGMIADFTDFDKVLKVKKKMGSQNNPEISIKGKAKKIKLPDVFSCIELSMFCKNTNYSKIPEFNDVDVTFGEYIFHKQIIPHVKRLQKFVGFNYLYLYAADSSEEKTLVEYYINKLGFTVLDDDLIIPIQPAWDFDCTFLYMPLDKNSIN